MRKAIVCVVSLLILAGCEKTIKEAQTPQQQPLVIQAHRPHAA